jgi:hypothetical protein
MKTLGAALLFFLPPSLSAALALASFPDALAGVAFNDDAVYRAEVAAFAVAGLNGGSFSVDEREAPAHWSPFGPHGPAYPALYGSVVRVLRSVPAAHCLFLALGGLAWFLLARPAPWEAALAGLLLATFWPCWLFLPSAMQEPLHAAFALLLAGLYSRRGTAGGKAAFVGAALFAALFRVGWALVLVPYALTGFRRRRAAAVFAAVVLTALAGKTWAYLGSPYPNHLADVLAAFGPVRGAWQLLARTPLSRSAYLSLSEGWVVDCLRYSVVSTLAVLALRGRRFPLRAGLALIGLAALAVVCFPPTAVLGWLGLTELGVQLVVVALAAFPAGVLLLAARMGRTPEAERTATRFALGSLGLVLAALLFAYDVGTWRDYRVLASHLLLSLLVLLPCPSARPLLLGVLLMQALAFPAFRTTARQLHAPPDRPPAADLRPYLSFDPSAGRWENTVLLPRPDGMEEVRVPAGFGIAFCIRGVAVPPKSRYVLLSRSEAARWDCPLEPVADFAGATLWRRPGDQP